MIGVLFVPTAFTFLWMTVFGNSAIALDLGTAGGQIAHAVQENLSTALFKFLEYLPGSGFTSTLSIVLVAVFFITSADSGALVIDTLASGGEEDTPRWQRMYWCLLLGATATALLIAGGLGALQTATLLAALPFCFVMILLAFGLVRQTSADLAGITISDDEPATVSERLKRLFVPSSKAQIVRQLAERGAPRCDPSAQPCWRKAGPTAMSPRARAGRAHHHVRAGEPVRLQPGHPVAPPARLYRAGSLGRPPQPDLDADGAGRHRAPPRPYRPYRTADRE